MKFSYAWARVAAQNVTLKVCTVILAIVVLVQLFAITSLALRAPLIVERSCLTRTLSLASSQHSQDEIKAFLQEVLPERLDSDAHPHADYLSMEEAAAREREQAALGEKQMRQRFLFGEASISEKEILVNGDRLISIGKIKSVLPLVLRISVKQVSRSESNPYGLILATISQVEDKRDDEK